MHGRMNKFILKALDYKKLVFFPRQDAVIQSKPSGRIKFFRSFTQEFHLYTRLFSSTKSLKYIVVLYYVMYYISISTKVILEIFFINLKTLLVKILKYLTARHL